MKLITWNCNGAFRKKFEHLTAFDADILLIQECENPEESKDAKYIEWATNYLWSGDTKNKGIGIFAKPHIKLSKLDWPTEYNGHNVKHFLACSVNDQFNLLNVWLHQNNSPNFGYIGQLWKYIQINRHNLINCIIAGDFNSNVKWDEWDRWWNHSDVVRELADLQIISLYHHITLEDQGNETAPTFHLQRNLIKPYHIDYCFASTNLISAKPHVMVGKFHEWINISDHVPLIIHL